MADITSITGDPAQEGDIVKSPWINEVQGEFERLNQEISQLNRRFSAAEEIVRPFRSTPLSGLTLAYAGGSVKLINGDILDIPAGTIEAPDNTDSHLIINQAGEVTIEEAPGRPVYGYEIAKITAENGVITSIRPYPLAEIKPILPDLSDYVLVDDLASLARPYAWQDAGGILLEQESLLVLNSQYYIVPFDQVLPGTLVEDGFSPTSTDILEEGGGIDPPGDAGFYRVAAPADAFTGADTGARFTCGADGDFIFTVRVRVYNDEVENRGLGAKVSVFKNGVEEQIISQAESAEGDLVLNGSNITPLRMTRGEFANIQVYVSTGENCWVRSGSRVQVWRLPGQLLSRVSL